MIPDRRSYSLSKDQPILRQARRRRSAHAGGRPRTESDFWKSFNVEKLASYAAGARTLQAARSR